jgi:hypothetical protein
MTIISVSAIVFGVSGFILLIDLFGGDRPIKAMLGFGFIFTCWMSAILSLLFGFGMLGICWTVREEVSQIEIVDLIRTNYVSIIFIKDQKSPLTFYDADIYNAPLNDIKCRRTLSYSSYGILTKSITEAYCCKNDMAMEKE